MSISKEYLELFTHIAEQISLPNVEGVYLPKPVAESEKRTTSVL